MTSSMVGQNAAEPVEELLSTGIARTISVMFFVRIHMSTSSALECASPHPSVELTLYQDDVVVLASYIPTPVVPDCMINP